MVNLGSHSEEALLALWAQTLAELRARKLVRTSNVLGEYAERLAARALGLKLKTPSHAGYDALDRKERRYQIKARLLRGRPGDRQLGVMRDFDFEFLVVVLVREDFSETEIWKLPVDLVRERAKPSAYQNGWILHANGPLLADPRAERVVG
jgi:hypothetical protein